ncbi:MAG TPA: quinone-dependent dihydroorotate dehydrogenase [Micromonosporaceae bacterium]
MARPWLFRLGGGDAETAHEWTLSRLATLCRHERALGLLSRALAVPSAPVEVLGLRFPNPVGLAAGMDKDGVALPAWPAMGFGFVEVGTVTRHAQPGNDRPRVFRLRASSALINRMGFNNAGAPALARRLATSPRLPVPLGISLGKSRVTPVERAVEDYVASFVELRPYGDYFAVNVSSPNTPGLRALQDRAHLAALLAALRDANRAGQPRPILVKIAPDLTDHAVAELLDVCRDHGVAGLIATNTTLSRDGLAPADVVLGEQAGGLSGAPLASRARDVVAFVHRETAGALPVIGVGGIVCADDARRLVDAGASLVQLFTGFVYRGPRLIRDVVATLSEAGMVRAEVC